MSEVSDGAQKDKRKREQRNYIFVKPHMHVWVSIGKASEQST